MKKCLTLVLALLVHTSVHAANAATAAATAAANTAPQPGMVVNAHWLAEHLSDPGMVLLHVGSKDEYRSRHLPGARLVTLADISVERDELTLELPSEAQLKRRLGALGIDKASTVVVYYGKDQIASATRVVFTLYAAGLGDHVVLLDGGMGEWSRLGQPTTAQVPREASGAGPDVHFLPVIVDAAFVRAHAHTPGYTLIDARAPVYYDGVEASGDMRKMRNGHIPGARNIPYTSVVNTDLTLKPRAQLEALFRAAGVGPAAHLIVYCHIGQQATAILFAARELGIDAVLYDGSFEDWTWHDGQVEARAEH
ncbi:MAG TPA: rhodanese-like domain-containing protein [Telluria sp.]|nr:rhodanese-like domain-containing protein [Telluria sp.]